MLAKVNGLPKNAVVLLAVLIIAVSSIIITLIATGRNSAESLEDFQEKFISEYGVKPHIVVGVKAESEDQAKKIAEDYSKELKLGKVKNPGIKETDGSQFYFTTNKDESYWIHASYK